jgi:5-methylcytosine-specific restriction endonuclease McrA
VRHRSGRWVAATVAYLRTRDGNRCGRCAEYVDPRLSGTHPDGGTIGHRVALAVGGLNTLENLRLEHRRCNLGAGVDGGALPAPAIVEPWAS